MPKYLATDVGNVLTTVDFDGFLNVLSKSLNISLSEAMHFLERTQKSHDLGLSKIKDELIDHFKIKSETLIDEIIKNWLSSMVPDECMMQVIAKLINNYDVKVAILSNVGDEHVSIIDDMLKKYGVEDKVVKHYSCQVGARKPSKLYYQSFLMENPEFKGCLYLDDLHDNLKSAKSFGFNPMYVNLQNGKFNNKTYADNVENEIKKNLLIETIIIQKIGDKSVREAFVVNTNSFDLFDNGELY